MSHSAVKVTRIAATTRAAIGTVWSDDVCRRAIELYDDIFRRCRDEDPDCGFEQTYASGRRSLHARAAAEPWPVPEAVAGAVSHLFELAAGLPESRIGDWIDLFPAAFMAAIERRLSTRPPASTWAGPRRRFVDRYAAAAPVI